ncbi:ABC transporter substrate-binding protein [Reyranella sp. CPCC 100927]|uniref:ABC transporter substrate-binding protein n=1 Tax=Reyranella sp. CPCC 100927 TaxID=2599616 RepID=UPI001C49B608|nr:ABC transporter substrate-binding protein [Reyranella sp. CPCC 100927]
MMRSLLAAIASACLALPAAAQTLTLLRNIDAPHYDPARTSAGATAEIVFIIGDTLVGLDYDLKTVTPLLAKSWTVSPDGKLYTFKLRDDVTFCSGRKMTAADVVFSFKRVLDPEIKSPFVWRMGPVKDIRAPDPHTVEYELEAPFGELLLQLTNFQATVLNPENVAALGKDFGVKGFDGTGPFCFQSWEPRNQTVALRHAAYRWGPPLYKNPGPAKYERVVWRIVPEEAARLAAMASGQIDMTYSMPDQYLPQLAKMPSIEILRPAANLRLFYFGFKASRENVSDPRVRTALSQAIDRRQLVDAIYFGNGEPAATYLHPKTPDFDPATSTHLGTYDPAAAGRLLDEAGWTLSGDGFRYKDGKKLTLLLYGFAGGRSPKMAEAVQGFWRKIGVDLQLQMWDGTIVFSKLAQQDYDLWSIAFPYSSAGDALRLYFHSTNIPTPNRMNWKDPQTDRWLEAGVTALDAKARFDAFAQVQKIVHQNALWVPLVHEGLALVVNKRVKNVRAHHVYTSMIYKALDASP